MMTDTCGCPPDTGADTCEPYVAPQPTVCPTCQHSGKPVDSLTLKALLAVPLTRLRTEEYRFCRSLDCPTVYYSADGTLTFTEADLREHVYQKHPMDDSVFVCYCFRHTLGDIKAEWVETHTSAVIEDITAGIRANQCACDIRNPQGSCCLGNVQAVIKRLEAQVTR